MTTEHPFAKELRAVADGRKLQFKDRALDPSERNHWNALEADNTEVWPWLLSTDQQDAEVSRFKFRIALPTISIAGEEVEAPINSAKSGDKYFTFDQSGEVHPVTMQVNLYHQRMLENGFLWETPEAAKQAYQAISKILTSI